MNRERNIKRDADDPVLSGPSVPPARTDTERLDWLEARAERQHDKETGERFYEISDAKELSGWSMSLRAAIDAAMAGTESSATSTAGR